MLIDWLIDQLWLVSIFQVILVYFILTTILTKYGIVMGYLIQGRPKHYVVLTTILINNINMGCLFGQQRPDAVKKYAMVDYDRFHLL